jgi:hypothetical protein
MASGSRRIAARDVLVDLLVAFTVLFERIGFFGAVVFPELNQEGQQDHQQPQDGLDHLVVVG